MIQLKRLTQSGLYLPFIDGLRFFAILPVILVHFFDFYDSHTQAIIETDTFSRLHVNSILGNSNTAVMLFFVISGFVLGLPFAKHFLNGETKPSLKSFYIRRVFRLEPPYLLVLTVLVILNVFLFHKTSLLEILPNYVASVFYAHNLIFQAYPVVNFVFWSLEIEVQFYLLAPFIAYVFKFTTINRRIILSSIILLFATLNQLYHPPFISLFNYIHYFLAGFLALDFYLNIQLKKSLIFDGVTLVLLLFFWTSLVTYGIALPFILAAFIFFSSQTILFFKLISLPFISIIGGMCYSLYMLHSPVMAVFLNRIVGNDVLFDSIFLDVAVKFMITIPIIFLISAIFFILVERPCMKKDWYKNVLKNF